MISSGTQGRPYVPITMAQLTNDLKLGYKLTNAGKFQEALEKFRAILATIPFVILQQGEDQEIQFLIRVCFEYVMALNSEILKKSVPSRSLELTAFMALCNMQP